MTYLEKKFLYYTECQLATLEYFKGRKSMSKSEINRHEKIAQGMSEICESIMHDLPPDMSLHEKRMQLRECPRLAGILLPPR